MGGAHAKRFEATRIRVAVKRRRFRGAAVEADWSRPRPPDRARQKRQTPTHSARSPPRHPQHHAQPSAEFASVLRPDPQAASARTRLRRKGHPLAAIENRPPGCEFAGIANSRPVDELGHEVVPFQRRARICA